jgi:hypothetical protein
MIRVENRLAGTQDIITVTGLMPGDTVRVYADGGTVSPLSSATVGSGSTAASVSISQLGTAAGHVYVTVTQPACSESRRIVKSYLAEPLSVAPTAASIRVNNHAGGTSDQVILRGLQTGDTVKVYRDKPKNQLLGSAVTAAGHTEGTTVSVGQLGAAEGVIYVTVTEPGQRESRVTEKAYEGEPQSPKPILGTIRIINEPGGTGDRAEVSGLHAGDVVKVYAAEQASAPLAQAAVTSGASSAEVVLPQLGAGEGLVYISVTRPPMQESVRVSKRFSQEPVTAAPAPGMIVVTNEAGETEDRVELYGLSSGDTVKVYPDASSTHILGTAVAAAQSSKVTVPVPQLGKQAGTVYITVTSPPKGESRRVIKAFAAELASLPPERTDIQAHNAAGPNDSVTLTGLQPGDIVKLYYEELSTAPASSAVVAPGLNAAAVQTTFPSEGYGVVYVTVTRPHEEESARMLKIYAAEPVTLPVSPHQIRVVNITDGAGGDEISILGLKEGDRVRLYADAEAKEPVQTLTGADAEAAAGNGQTTVTINRLKLEPNGGKIYVSLTSNGKRESTRTLKAYEAE